MSATVQIGESFISEGPEAAHVNTVLGDRDGPAGAAWAGALAAPSAGHVPFVAVLRPSLPVKPLTLFVTKAAAVSTTHGHLTWGAAQAGIAGGVADAVADGVLTREQADTWVLVAAVWVNPEAADADAVYANNRRAVSEALRNGVEGLPGVDAVLAERHAVHNPFYTPSG